MAPCNFAMWWPDGSRTVISGESWQDVLDKQKAYLEKRLHDEKQKETNNMSKKEKENDKTPNDSYLMSLD